MKWLKNIWSWLDRNKTRLFYISAAVCAYDYISFFLAGFFDSYLHISALWSIATFIGKLLDLVSIVQRIVSPSSPYMGLPIVLVIYGLFILSSLFNVIFNPKWLVKLTALLVAFLHLFTIFILLALWARSL